MRTRTCDSYPPSDTHRYVHVYTHTHTRTPASNYLSWSTYETHMQKHLRTRTFDLSFYSTTQAIHRDMYMYTHIHPHARDHATILYQAPMKHTCKNMCALALLTHPSTRTSKPQAPMKHIWRHMCTRTLTHTSTLPNKRVSHCSLAVSSALSL